MGTKHYTNNRNPDQMDWEQSNPKIYVNTNIIDRLMEVRRIASYSILAALIGFHNTCMYRIVKGLAVPNPKNLARMCAVLGCQPGDLLYMAYNFKDQPDNAV